MLWRAITIAGVLTLSYLFGPWQLFLALLAAASYAIVIHPGWNHDERARQAVALREQSLPLLADLPRSDFSSGGQFANTPFDATAWLQAAWGHHLSGEIFQLLGWQQEVLLATAAESQDHHRELLRAFLHETKPVATELP